MFTGIVEEVGTVRSLDSHRLTISAHEVLNGTRLGDSIAVNGACLTVVDIQDGIFSVEIMPETIRRTNIGSLAFGNIVNLERSLSVGDRLGGHIVTGHVDGIATVAGVVRTANGRDVSLEVPEGLAHHIVARGSIAVDGVSLTVADVDRTRVTVSLIPETLKRTVAGAYVRGTKVNIEADVIAKYQESRGQDSEREGHEPDRGITIERLRELGFTE